MYMPDTFLPSSSVRKQTYDPEGRLREFRIGPDGAHEQLGGIGEYNSMFHTDAEAFGTMAPFLKKNKAVDAKRRLYVIQPGGAAIYFEDKPLLRDAWDNNRVQYTAPSDQEQFGHNSQPGGPCQGPNGRTFSLGHSGNSTGG